MLYLARGGRGWRVLDLGGLEGVESGVGTGGGKKGDEGEGMGMEGW